MRYLVALLVVLPGTLFWGCSPQLKSHWLTGLDQVAEQPPETDRSGLFTRQKAFRPGCLDWSYYLPDTLHPQHLVLRKVRVNFHFLNTTDSTRNYSQEEGENFIRGLLIAANKDLRTNNKVWLPYDNRLPTLTVGYQMELFPNSGRAGDTGIYYHYDDELAFYIHRGKNNNLADRGVLRKYGVQTDSVLNIFIMPHHPDSVASPTYKAGPVGVSLGNAIKLAGFYENKQPNWAYRGVLNHEVGHVFGLQHAWMGDGCSDTPVHRNPCWTRTSTPPCDKAASNNVMDYNALQNAWTPCQVGKILSNLYSHNGSGRKYLKPDWNRFHPNKSIVITDSIAWMGERDLYGNITIAEGGVLVLGCRISMPPGGKITVAPGGKLILKNTYLHQDGGKDWQGIEVQEIGKQKGRVSLEGAVVLENIKPPNH